MRSVDPIWHLILIVTIPSVLLIVGVVVLILARRRSRRNLYIEIPEEIRDPEQRFTEKMKGNRTNLTFLTLPSHYQ